MLQEKVNHGGPVVLAGELQRGEAVLAVVEIDECDLLLPFYRML